MMRVIDDSQKRIDQGLHTAVQTDTDKQTAGEFIKNVLDQSLYMYTAKINVNGQLGSNFPDNASLTTDFSYADENERFTLGLVLDHKPTDETITIQNWSISTRGGLATKIVHT